MIVGIGIPAVSSGFDVRNIPHSLGLGADFLRQRIGERRWGTGGTTNPITLDVVEVCGSKIGPRDIPWSPCPVPRIALRMLSAASNELQYTGRKKNR